MKPNAAYTALRELGLQPRQARWVLIGLRQRGFVLAKEKEMATAKQINRQIENIIKLMRAGNRRRK